MGIGIGMSNSGVERTVIRRGNKQTTKTVLRRADGTYAGTISVTQSVKKKSKRLNYNFKEISAMILQTKTSGSARQVISRAKGKIALLRQRLKCGEYDDKELESAIAHAEKMERIARKRMRHLQEEEMAKRGGPCQGEEEQEEEYEIIEEIQPDTEEAGQEAELELDRRQQEAMLRKHQQELQQEMQKMMREMMEQTQRELSELSDMEELSDALGGGSVDMDPKELDDLKRKHRLDEQREIMEADMAYLKALFYKLAQEKQQNASGSSGGGDSSGSGVSLELGGVELPVETPEAPVMPEGGNIDTTV